MPRIVERWVLFKYSTRTSLRLSAERTEILEAKAGSGKSFDDEWVVMVEGFASAGVEIHAAIGFHSDGAIAIELDLESPTQSVRQL